MPLFKGEGYKCTPDKAIEYITRPGKAVLVSSLYLDDTRNYAKQFRETAYSFGKGKAFGERKYYHFKLSADPKDHISPKESQRLAEELAQQLFPDHECVIATHIDTGIVHSHIIVNSVNFATGLKLHVSDHEYAAMKDRTNDIAAKHGLRTLDWRKSANKRVKQAEHHISKNGKTCWKDELRKTLDQAISECDSFISLRNYLERQDIKLSRITDKTISFIYPGQKKSVRGDTLGVAYSRSAIEQRLREPKEQVKAQKSIAERLAENKAISNRNQRFSVDQVDHQQAVSFSGGISERLAAAKEVVKEHQEQKAVASEPNITAEHRKAYCPNLTESKPVRLNFLQKLKAMFLGYLRSVSRKPFDYRVYSQTKYNSKVMAATLKVLSQNNIGSIRDLEKRLQLLAGNVAKLEFSQQSLNSEITRLQQIHGALCNYNAYSHIADQYKSKVFFRDKFFRENEAQLRAYAKAQKILSMYQIDPCKSPIEVKEQINELLQQRSILSKELRVAKDTLYQWQRIERNLHKVLEDRQPKYRLDREPNKDKPQRIKKKNRERTTSI